MTPIDMPENGSSPSSNPSTSKSDSDRQTKSQEQQNSIKAALHLDHFLDENNNSNNKHRDQFLKDGFAFFQHNDNNNDKTLKPATPSPSNTQEIITLLKSRLTAILAGTYPDPPMEGKRPDKLPKIPVNPPSKQFQQKKRVLQIVNIHKGDGAFRNLATCPELGRLVAILGGWEDVGVRLAQDQIWMKPPGAPPLTYHRDSPYFMFAPDHVITVWISLDELTMEMGPLRYVKGSHLWEEKEEEDRSSSSRVGTSSSFFQADGGVRLVHSAARRAGIPQTDVQFVSTCGFQAGDFSVHDGRTWHGSGKNTSPKDRTGLGLHFVPANVTFTEEAKKSRLWRKYVEEEDGVVDDWDMPLVWSPRMDLTVN